MDGMDGMDDKGLKEILQGRHQDFNPTKAKLQIVTSH